ncbi:MAG: NAD(P)/FAD-dependent oxidoreductase [Gammaproteobacteria bacterium]|nr:NAD(P)/FAD-dependent oxidoreductase [Gammaproteobacteria bacterium]
MVSTTCTNDQASAAGTARPASAPLHCDVLVMGGGPAGTTAATLLAERGWSVTVLEAEYHPRFHIGESLLPMNLPLLDRLGILDRVRTMGIHKPAADFTGAGEHEFQSFPFSLALGNAPDHAFQVLRSQFDAALFDRCREAGAVVLEGHRARRVSLADGGEHAVTVEQPDGDTVTCRCRYLLDASGQASVLARAQGWRQRDRQHAAVAFFAHFRDVPQRDQPWSGNISIYWFESGWIWMIPLRDGVTSVGAVCDASQARQRDSDIQAYYEQVLAGCPAAAERLRHGRRISPVRSAGNYSYCSSRQTGPGFALIGDAYTFIDPVFSSGVYLAMSSADALAPAIEHWLHGRHLRYRLAAFAYRRRIRRGIRAFKWFIYRFNSPAMAWLFAHPRNVLNVERAVVSLLAGDVYDNRRVRAHLLVFKVLFAVVSVIGRYRPELLKRPGRRQSKAYRHTAGSTLQ